MEKNPQQGSGNLHHTGGGAITEQAHLCGACW